MNVLVVGGTGFVGSALCTELAERGHDVTALSRDPTDASLPGDVDTAAGDVTDVDSIDAAFEGRDAVVNFVALSPLFKPSGGDEMHDRVHRAGTENVVEAAERHGVARLVQVSALGADPEGATAYIRAKGRAEEIVRASALDRVILRPSVVFGDGGEFVPFTKLLTTPYVTGLPGGGDTRFQPIWVGDLAPILADAVLDEAGVDGAVGGGSPVGETYAVGGPDVLTLADVARAAYRAEGKSVRVLPVPMVLARIGLALADVVPGIPMGTDQYRSLQFDNTVDENDLDAFGRSASDLRTLRSYLEDAGADDPEPDPTAARTGETVDA